MVNFDRPFPSFSLRFQALAAGAAVAFITGLAAPAAAAASVDSAAPTVENVAMVAAEANNNSPSSAQLHPTEIQGAQVTITPNAQQMKNAQAIIQAGQNLGLPPRAWVIAVATSLQETKLNNYGDLGADNDHDSLGLFQQRPSSGWGSPDQLKNPDYASKAFYKSLIAVKNWDKMPLTDAAQAVQVSAYPDRYAQWEAHAGDIVTAFYGQGPLAANAKQVM